MNATIDTITLQKMSTEAGRTRVRRLGIAILVAALVSATACGNDTATTTTPAASIAGSTSTTSVVSTTVATATTATTVTRPTATIDELIGVAGERVHIRCVGQGDTTVLLIAGFEGGSEGWVKTEPAIAARSRVCSYDRPGTGTSDPAAATETFSSQASDLHALLSTVGEPGPYVVVGHSFGGAEAVTFASLFADEVTGLVLVDASPATWPAALCNVTDDGSDGATMLRATCTGLFLPTGNREHLDVDAAFAEVSGIASLGSLPMTVITATDRQLPADLAASEVAHLTDVWNQGQQDWAALSTTAHVTSVDQTGHHIEIDQPGVVIDEITRLLP